MKLISLLLSINLVVIANEVSVFGAGDLESSNPYGLTSSEKVILKNKNKLNKFDRKIDDTRSNIELISERIEGLESILDGSSRKLNSSSIKLDKLNLDYQATKEYLKEYLGEIEEVQKKHTLDINKIKIDFIDLLKTIDKDYVTKKQFDELVVFVNKQFSKKTKKVVQEKKINFNKSKKDLLAEARKLFKKDYFTKAIPILEYLVKEKYRPAECSFYLGEIWFYRKKYKEAIHYFKNSMMLYDKASYIPKLLLHSAISFEKTNDLDNAANFYGTLIDVYPDTKEAQKAQNNLAKFNK